MCVFVLHRVRFKLDSREVKCLRSLGVERISFCCPPIFDWLAPAHEDDGAVPIIQLPRPLLPPHPHPTLLCLFPKRLAFLGATSEAAFRGKARWLLGGLLCTGSKGRRQCLINWLGVLGRVQEFAEGGSMEGRDDWGRFTVHQQRFIDLCFRFMSVWFTLRWGGQDRRQCGGGCTAVTQKLFFKITFKSITFKFCNIKTFQFGCN